ncbi:MAG: primosomal protein N' [Phycisphaerales bacterium]|nr:primosomal protein N' [Phycisphaeraceae bacterium]
MTVESLFPQAEASALGTLVSVVVHRGIERVGTARGAAGAGASSSAGGASGAALAEDVSLAYRLGPGQEVPVPGQLVRVPLGRKNTPTTGVVIGTPTAEQIRELARLDPSKIKPLLEVTPAAIPGSLLELGRWLSTYYVCPLGMVLQALLPSAVKKQVGRTRVRRLTLATLSPGEADERVRGLPRIGKRLGAALDRLRDAARAGEVALPATPAALRAAIPDLTTPTLARLVREGALIESTSSEVVARGAANSAVDAPAAAIGPKPNAEQQRIIDAVASTFGSFHSHLVLGVTGSGKTEVYLRLISEMLAPSARGGESEGPPPGVIVLVPEIALTPQTCRRFTDRFGHSSVAVLHSGLSNSERHRQWSLVASGAVRVVVGARSAVFAPMARVGLIIVDEEHDTSYKQDQLPRYHARDVAIKRAHLESCPVVLGSATPSLESYANASAAAASGGSKWTMHRLTRRATGSPMPAVRIVDLLEERRIRAQHVPASVRDRHLHLLGPTLEAELTRTLDTPGAQAILLLNRRGFANYLCCPDARCGWIMRCDACDATSVYHLAIDHASGMPSRSLPGFVRCHHCLAETRLPAKCPLCARPVNTFGLGTQRLEQELERKFGSTHGLNIGTTMLRFDADTMRTAADYARALDAFASGRARVLLGTQMIAKGLDFPGVVLVGVVHADTGLEMPDFRASERTFQLVSQVAGRAGRVGTVPGRVIVQTVHPQQPAIVLAARHEYERFAQEELRTRAQAGLPPSSKMARIVCRDLDFAACVRHAQEVAAALREAAAALGAPGRGPESHAVRIRGPAAAPISRIAHHHRQSIELIAPTRGTIQAILASARARGLLVSDDRTAVDVDPVSLL